MVMEKDCCPEDAYREVTQCYALTGDCASATEYFRRRQQFLRNEPAMAPVDETLNRAQDSLCSTLASHPLT
jgi:DNA-binding SARP family transcriptional activator